MHILALDGRWTVVSAILVLFFGKWLNSRVRLLQGFNVPEPVTGGLVASCFLALLFGFFDFKVSFDLALRDELLIVFFTTVGLSARFVT
ncbi:MAG: sodium/glutamate symporter, partial [Pseudomonadota bacterium]